VPHFRDRYTCLVFDHRGFGRSDDADSRGGAAFAGDLEALLDHAGIDRADLVAQSMGGWTCLRFALRSPARVGRLVMCDTHGGVATPEIAAAWASSRPALAALPPGVHPAAGERMFREQPVLHFLYTEVQALSAQRSFEEMNAIIRAAGTVTPDELSGFDIATLFITGEEDVVIPPSVIDLAAALFPRARVERVPNAGHSVYFEHADAFNAVVERFLVEP
jgi:pimeloyl-ACP methyl ester carboxylesterase